MSRHSLAQQIKQRFHLAFTLASIFWLLGFSRCISACYLYSSLMRLQTWSALPLFSPTLLSATRRLLNALQEQVRWGDFLKMVWAQLWSQHLPVSLSLPRKMPYIFIGRSIEKTWLLRSSTLIFKFLPLDLNEGTCQSSGVGWHLQHCHSSLRWDTDQSGVRFPANGGFNMRRAAIVVIAKFAVRITNSILFSKLLLN